MSPKIRTVHIRRFRSIESASIEKCGELNVLIGKNNAGKSNLLATIRLMHAHLQGERVAGPWRTERPADEFTDRIIGDPVKIGVELSLPTEMNNELRTMLKNTAPHLERSVDQIEPLDTISFILAGAYINNSPFLYFEQITIGHISSCDHGIEANGINLLTVPLTTAQELYVNFQESTSFRTYLEGLRRFSEDRAFAESMFKDRSPYTTQYLLQRYFGEQPQHDVARKFRQLFESVTSPSEFGPIVSQAIAEAQEHIRNVEAKNTVTPMTGFAGEVRATPGYVSSLLKNFGSLVLLHLTENKRPIGREEAEQLLSLKVKRGGPERLKVVQQTVQDLLGVNVDAFQAASPRGGAEMDIDEFLVEANGSGIREALRLILDLELKKPDLALIEEPEAHLHPGLEHAIHTYLKEKSSSIQLFVNTHSTNFVDSVSFQNIYLVSRNEQKRTTCEQIGVGDAPLRIPAELGLRLSTVFMYDRLVFVEGPSDEAVFREIARKLTADLARCNVAFVHMGGVRNFAYFAAQGTLDLLAKRRIQMWFLIDRDEKDGEEIRQMLERLGQRAKLVVLQRRELENYLLDPTAIVRFLNTKAGLKQQQLSVEDVSKQIKEAALSLKDEVIRLRLEKRMLRPIFLQRRDIEGTIENRLKRAEEIASERRNALPREISAITGEVERNWDVAHAVEWAPGTKILELTCHALGSDFNFNKSSGDSARIAQYMEPNVIEQEIKYLLEEIGS